MAAKTQGLVIWLAPAVLCLVALAPLPYGFYTPIRIVVCGSTGFLCWTEWTRASRWNGWAVVMAIAAALFNPILPVHLARGGWVPIDLGMAALFAAHLFVVRRRPDAVAGRA